MIPFSFAVPWLLLGLFGLLLLPRRRHWPWRFAALGLLIVALAQPQLDRPSRAVSVLIDVSESVGEAASEAYAAFDFSQLPNPPALFLFAGDTTGVAADTANGAGLEPPASLVRNRTDIARALQVAAASSGRVLLLSDGAESAGDARLALPGVPVDTFVVASRDNVRLADLLAPESVAPGETVEVTAVVESDRATEVRLQPTVNGEELEPITRQVQPGRTPLRFRFPVGGDGDVSLSARIDADFAQPSADDNQRTTIAVSEEDPLLVIGDPAVGELLRRQGFSVRDGTASDVTNPLNYSAIVLRSGIEPFTPGQLELLRSYVENGGGLMMTGGPESFGLGAWYRTPVEAVLPVTTDLRTEVELPLVAMVVVLDRSQSMSTGRPSKISLAKEGAIGMVELAYQQDLLGLITFSDSSEWAFNLRPATERGKREMLNAILNLDTQGGTILEPAYDQALGALRDSEAAIKHIIVLTDGQLYDGRGPFGGGGSGTDFNAMAEQGLRDGITTSAIAIGEGADFQRLEAIARAGGGRYYSALDVSTLPRIFTSEALTATRSLLREGRIAPTLRAHPLTPEGITAPPPVNAYIASSLKRDSEMILEGQEREPILAVSRQGLGRTAALTTDLNAWAGDFGAWPALPGVLGTVTRWLQAQPAEFSATVTPVGNRLQVVVDAVKDGEYINNRELEARYGGVQASLQQVAPGRYQGTIDTPAEGGTLLVVSGSEIVARSRVSTPNAEFDTAGGDTLLRDIARLTGGELLAEPGVYAPSTPNERTPVWPWFAVAGFTLFVAELLLRRFGWPSRWPWQAREDVGEAA
ncbi:MAG: VWA domain-containing protein [Trueperaceae bacterium]|nr:VWA domain-containing protein [Trueperaceae bacterium]